MIEKKYIAIVTLALALAMIPACADKAQIGIPDDRTESFPTSVFSADLSSDASNPTAASIKVKYEVFPYGYFPEPSFESESPPEKFDDTKIGAEYDGSSEFFELKRATNSERSP